MAFISSLQLSNFRCYDSAALDGLSSGPVVLYGANGAGKTNILEALSFLAPGRGLRGAKVAEVQKRGASRTEAPWAVSALVESAYGPARIGTGADAMAEKRLVRVNGAAAKSQAVLSEYLSCVWLTPQMDRLFLEGASSRRRFLDRLVFTFDPAHAGRVTRYENALSQRSRLLKENARPDPAWLEALEGAMAETGIAVSAARLDFARRLQEACRQAVGVEAALFPRARLAVTGTVEELLCNAPALEVEEMFRYQLRQTRAQDALNGGAATGPHRADLSVRYEAKDMPAAQCSTGEQKALLMGIILAHSRLIAAERGAPPMLLLDEVAAHLDESRRGALYELLLAPGGQVWLTGTDRSLFADLEGRAAFFEVEKSAVLQEPRDSGVQVA